MRTLILPFVLAAHLATPVHAQTAPTEDQDGLSLMERGAQLFMEGILKEMEPAMDNLQELAEQFGPALRGFVQEMGPALSDLMDKVEDWSVYHPPEMLENGDIIIRRKSDDEIAREADEIEI